LKTRTGSRYNVTPGIVWALKLQGDINETHAGGDALHALIERLQLIEELCVSVREDMEQYKSGVMAGL
jgi:hypothetical protein